MTNKEKFLKLVSTGPTSTMKAIQARIKNRKMLRESQQIALKVLVKLDELGWLQKDLAEALNVSPQQVNKIVKGKENLTLETLTKLQELLDIPLLASYYEDQIEKLEAFILTFKKVEEYDVATASTSNYIPGNVIKMKFDNISNENSYNEAV